MGNVHHLRSEAEALLKDPSHRPGVALALLADETGRRQGTANHTFRAACHVGASTFLGPAEVSPRAARLLGIEPAGETIGWNAELLALAALDAQNRAWHGRREALGYHQEYLAGEVILAILAQGDLQLRAVQAIQRRAAYAALMEVKGAPETTCLTEGCRVGHAADPVLAGLLDWIRGREVQGLPQPYMDGVRWLANSRHPHEILHPSALTSVESIVGVLRATGMRLHPDRTMEWWGADGWWCAEMASLEGCVDEGPDGKQGVRRVFAQRDRWWADGVATPSRTEAEWYLKIGHEGVLVLRSPGGAKTPAPPPEPEAPEPKLATLRQNLQRIRDNKNLPSLPRWAKKAAHEALRELDQRGAW